MIIFATEIDKPKWKMAKMPAKNSLKRKNRDVSNDKDRKSPPEEIKVATTATVVVTVVNDPSSSEEEEDCKVTASMTTKWKQPPSLPRAS